MIFPITILGGINMANKDYFFCYTKKVSDYLNEKGLQFITVAKSVSNHKIFSLYEITPALQEALKEYKNLK